MRLRWGIVGGVLLIAGLASFAKPVQQAAISFAGERVDASTEADGRIEALLKPYRDGVVAYGSEVICHAKEKLIAKQKPENGLANMVADGMKIIGEKAFGQKADLAVTNFGGLRRNLEQGPITVGLITELSPFENFLMLIEVKGDTVLHIAKLVARDKGRPISGLQVGYNADGFLMDAFIDGKPIDPNGIYKIITIDYLFATSSMFKDREVISKATAGRRQRDAIIEYLRLLDKKGIQLANAGDGRVYEVAH